MDIKLKCIAFILVVLLIPTLVFAETTIGDPLTDSESVVLVDSTGETLYSQDAGPKVTIGVGPAWTIQ